MSVRGRRIKLGLLLGAVASLVVAGAVGALLRPPLEPDQVVENRFGDVSWNHELHARMKEIANCQVCHHKERPGTMRPKACRHCHKPESNQDALVLADLHLAKLPEPKKYDGENGPPAMTAFHGKCVGCHKAMKKGPVVCRDCHAQAFTGKHGRVEWDHLAHSRRIDMGGEGGLAGNCVVCHHQDKEAQTDGEFRACGKCHKMAAVKGLEVKTEIKKHEKLRHGDCKRCHMVSNPEDDLRTCKDCHKKWDVDTKVERPVLEQAIHKRCRQCHQKDYKGLTKGMPALCEDCHKPDPSMIADVEIGLMLWDHDRHGKYGDGMTCNKCHHTDGKEQPHMACNRCHGTGLYKNPPVTEALRKRCLGCHKEKNNGLLAWDQVDTKRQDVTLYKYEGPDGTFTWNHAQHAVAWSFSCRNCHHGILRQDGKYVSGEKAEVAWTGEAAQIQACKQCHGPDGPVPGSPAATTKAPKYDDAFKKVCLECHKRLGGGPQEWADFFKVEPIKAPKATEGGDEASQSSSKEPVQ